MALALLAAAAVAAMAAGAPPPPPPPPPTPPPPPPLPDAQTINAGVMLLTQDSFNEVVEAAVN